MPTDGLVSLGLLDDPDRRRRRNLTWDPAEGLLIVGADHAAVDRALTTVIAGLVRVRPAHPVYVVAGVDVNPALARLPMVVDVIDPSDDERIRRLIDRLATSPATLVLHRWSLVADAVGTVAEERLAQLVRRPGPGVVVTAATDREVPSRVASHLAERLVFELSDPHGYLGFGLRPSDVPALGGMAVVHPRSGLTGQVGVSSRHLLATLAADRRPDGQPPPIEVLGERVARADLPGPRPSPRGVRIAIGRDVELAVHDIEVDDHVPIVVLGRPGSGRTTVLDTIRSQVADVVVVDDAERLPADEGPRVVSVAREERRPVLIAATPATARAFGSWLGPLLGQATVILLNPTRADSELCRVVGPDLAAAPVGRALVVDRGLVSVVQLAA